MKRLLMTLVLAAGTVSAAPPSTPPAPSDMEQQRTLESLAALDPLEVLERLAQLRQRAFQAEPVPIPVITLHLRSGRDLTGRVLSLAAPKGGERALLCEVTEGDRPSTTVAAVYVPVSAIEAVRVHEVNRVAQAAGLARPSAPVTRIEVERSASELARAVSSAAGKPVAFEVDWKSLPDTPEARRTVLQAMHSAALALRTLAQEEVGKTALSARLRKVSFTQARRAETQLSGSTLTVGFDVRTSAAPTEVRFPLARLMSGACVEGRRV
ncbi:hypothetical protein [Hyalangium sp.]|uniref:hypothetical protein n=1 Tax=Hyalangium sp. TaxID=2028555 RepID=UPI002D23C44B|nr:hypothetical protein [Hyalangium sp.]HYI01973.1 hypothetical protein [Hyalangium sp.]